MADKAISALTENTAPAADDWYIIETSGGNSRKVKTKNIRPHRGALVTKAADETTANYSAGAVVAWDTETGGYDTDSIHDTVTNNSRLTVPSGVSLVRLSFALSMQLVAAGADIQAFLKKNGSSAFIGNPLSTADQVSLTSLYVNGTSAVVSVTPGDYFEVQLHCSDTSITVTKDVSWFAMEIIQ